MESALRFANHFPTSACRETVQAIAKFHGINQKQVIVGCGSTDVMRMCANAFLKPQARLITADPTFEALHGYARQMRCPVVRISLNHRYEHDLSRMLSAARDVPHLIYVCNPNNPTGTITPREELEKFLQQLPGHSRVLIDEAYYEYAGVSDYESLAERAAGDPRLIVTRTFSKVYGLAGMRVGYGVAAEPTIRELAGYQLWAGVNIEALACSTALEDTDFVRISVKRNSDDRQEFFNQAQMRSLKPLDSHTNFYFMDVGRPAKEVISHFAKHKILIGPDFPSMNTFIRVSLGREDQMREFWRVWDLLPRGKMSM
jgi:histidinol-phosphate aminotransferase